MGDYALICEDINSFGLPLDDNALYYLCNVESGVARKLWGTDIVIDGARNLVNGIIYPFTLWGNQRFLLEQDLVLVCQSGYVHIWYDGLAYDEHWIFGSSLVSLSPLTFMVGQNIVRAGNMQKRMSYDYFMRRLCLSLC